MLFLLLQISNKIWFRFKFFHFLDLDPTVHVGDEYNQPAFVFDQVVNFEVVFDMLFFWSDRNFWAGRMVFMPLE
jgi:hypothetical protein